MEIVIKDLGDVPVAVEQLIEELGDDKIWAFFAEMGAGKTTLISEICNQKGVLDTVNSPTFAIINEYRTEDDDRICHFDFYRINKIEEAFDFGCEEYFDSGDLCLVEWSEKIEEILPADARRITITVAPNGTRTLKIV